MLSSTLVDRTVRENLRVVLTVSSLGPRFQKRCRDFPALINTVSVILLPHWSKEALVAHAYHLLKGIRNAVSLFVCLFSMRVKRKRHLMHVERLNCRDHLICNSSVLCLYSKYLTLIVIVCLSVRTDNNVNSSIVQVREQVKTSFVSLQAPIVTNI